MKGYYNPEQNGKGLEVPTGRLSIEVSNIPEFYKLIEQAKQEADQLKTTIDQLRRFELNIDFRAEQYITKPATQENTAENSKTKRTKKAYNIICNFADQTLAGVTLEISLEPSDWYRFQDQAFYQKMIQYLDGEEIRGGEVNAGSEKDIFPV